MIFGSLSAFSDSAHFDSLFHVRRSTAIVVIWAEEKKLKSGNSATCIIVGLRRGMCMGMIVTIGDL